MNKVAPLTHQLSISNLNREHIIVKKIIKDQFIQRMCRICLEEQIKDEDALAEMDEEEIQANQLIVPCQCSGSVGFVHNKCIKMWIEKQMTQNDSKRAFCQICKSEIHFSIEKVKEWDCQFKHCLRISPCSIITLVIQFMLISVTAVVQYYSDSLITNKFLQYLLIALLFLLVASALFTILLIFKESFVKTIKYIEKIYSLIESEERGLRSVRDLSSRHQRSTKNIRNHHRNISASNQPNHTIAVENLNLSHISRPSAYTRPDRISRGQQNSSQRPINAAILQVIN